MFDELKHQLALVGKTVQVPVSSDLIVPGIKEVDGTRQFTLTYDDSEYVCLEKAWVSWAQRMLTPQMIGAKQKKEAAEAHTNAKPRWSVSSIRKFLDLNSPEVSDMVVKRWWESHNPTEWSIIKYADSDEKLGGVRYIGTPVYRLYEHGKFLDDLSACGYGDMFNVQMQYLRENHMILRLTTKEPLPIQGSNIFSGFHLLNSENGSSSILIRHMIYDLICTNGMMKVFEDHTLVSQRHSRFDVDQFRAKVQDAAKKMPELHEASETRIGALWNIRIDGILLDGALELYRKTYDASEAFVDRVRKVYSPRSQNAWELVSSITQEAQSFGWPGRMFHEESAGDFTNMLLAGQHEKMAEEIQKKVDREIVVS